MAPFSVRRDTAGLRVVGFRRWTLDFILRPTVDPFV